MVFENELNQQLLDIQERGTKPSNPLPYNFHVNLDNGKIRMTNLRDNGVPLLLYDKNRLNTDHYHFSYALYAQQELSHDVQSGPYDYEVFGPNGFFRKFKGDATPDCEVLFINNPSKNQIELVFKNHKKAGLAINIEDLYEKNKKEVPLKKKNRGENNLRSYQK